ncbi:MAG: FAD-binding protein [Saprospiraceae bacterium]|nr:FAD-binding protein [Saprospiraceae bacterium]
MQLVDYRLLPEEIDDDAAHRKALAEQLELKDPHSFDYKIIRRNIDARARNVYFVFRAEVFKEAASSSSSISIEFNYKNVSDAKQVHVIGAGPCGYFAALKLIELGLKPIVIERGKDVRDRRRDLKSIQQDGIVNPDSNYCFGEGGAGTYSDGKLYTRSDKRGSIQSVLNILVDHGADPEIVIDVHPHIGSNRLPEIVANIRKTILKFGGEIHFNTKLQDLEIENQLVKKIITNHTTYDCSDVILATGHSARDIFELLNTKNCSLSYKPFALGVRIEHPQQVIDQIQYKQNPRHAKLPAASYSISCQIDGNGVFSFCMCPGGLIVPAATAPGELVMNGMSLSRRDSPFANSGFVCTVDASDFKKHAHYHALQGMYFQKEVEQKMFGLGDGSQKAPAQRLVDFIKKRKSLDLPDCSYIPGIFPASLHTELPNAISDRLRNAFIYFGERMSQFLHPDAIMVSPESRTSSPVKIPRDQQSLMHPDIKGLFPAGEGAGYAGGILSAAMDGQRVAQAVYNKINGKLVNA